MPKPFLRQKEIEKRRNCCALCGPFSLKWQSSFLKSDSSCSPSCEKRCVRSAARRVTMSRRDSPGDCRTFVQHDPPDMNQTSVSLIQRLKTPADAAAWSRFDAL